MIKCQVKISTSYQLTGKSCVERYIKKDTRVVQALKPTKEATFLAFTVCPSIGDSYKIPILENHGLTKKDYSRNGIFSSKLINKSPDELFDEITYGLTEIIDEIEVITEDFAKIAIDFKKDAAVFNMHHKWFGKCYSIELASHIIKQGISQIEFTSKLNTYIYFHHPR